MTAPEFSNAEELSKPTEVPTALREDGAQATVEAPADEAEDDFVFVKMPNGSVRAVPKSQIQTVEETAKQDAQATQAAPKPEDEFYVHTADGGVLRVKESDLPGGHGSNAPFGHWVKDGKVHTVIGVYPVESIIG